MLWAIDMNGRSKTGTSAPVVWAIQHVRPETPGKIGEALRSEGISTRIIRVFAGAQVPTELGAVAGLILMGGPMAVYELDRYPFLKREVGLIEQALRDEIPILGICLGSQLLASVLGARVEPGQHKEIGWYPVRLTRRAKADSLWQGIASPFVAFHWHGDTFKLPRNAVCLASSALTPCQAFRYGKNAYGILFHMEVTQTIIKAMVRAFAGELRTEAIVDNDILSRSRTYLHRLNQIGDTVFRRWAGLVRAAEGRRQDS